jgi:hypothetical protein
VTQQSSERESRRTSTGIATVVGSFAYGFVIGLIASIVFEGFDIGPNLLQAANFGVTCCRRRSLA